MRKLACMFFLSFVVMMLSCNVQAEEDYMTESGEIGQVEDGEAMTESGELEEVGSGTEYMTDSGAIEQMSHEGPTPSPAMGTGAGDEGGYPYLSDTSEGVEEGKRWDGE